MLKDYGIPCVLVSGTGINSKNNGETVEYAINTGERSRVKENDGFKNGTDTNVKIN